MSVTSHTAADGFTWRDLNQNGRLDPYEDPRRPIDERISDLLAQMTLEEKAGLMFHTMISMNPDGSLSEDGGPFGGAPTSVMVREQHLTHFNVLFAAPPRQMAEWHNRLQQLAQQTRLGIPVTISSDPRHAFTTNPAVSFMAGAFSQWPEPLGLAAIDDPALVEAFADIARREYLAVGIRVALHPQIDLATEPRWPRINGTFGEDAERTGRMAAAYVRGFQGAALGPHSVACMVKHFPGGGPQLDGHDPHFAWGREQVYPGGQFEYHLRPFATVLAAGAAQIMPYYGMPIGFDYPEVGFSFNRPVITGLLRERLGFDGVVCTDWGLLTDREIMGEPMPAASWGVEQLSRPEKIALVLEAGVDQFGGEACPEELVALVRSGRIAEARLDGSVRRLLRDKFRLGLFDAPLVDPAAAESIVGAAEFRAAGAAAQRAAFVLLKDDDRRLPLRARPRLYLEGVDPALAQHDAEIVTDPGEADLALIRLQTPHQPAPGGPAFFASLFRGGDLDVKDPERARLLALLARCPTIVDIALERPAVIPEIASACAVLLANFGASDAALLDVVFGRAVPRGTLPFELPSSMAAVRRQQSDVPYDSAEPLFPYGAGLR